MGNIFDLPCIAKHIEMQDVTRSIPHGSKKGFYLAPWHFDFSESAKYGQLGRFPSNCQYKLHLPSFLEHGLESHRESIEVKFHMPVLSSNVDANDFKIGPFSVGFVDGQNKALIIQSVLALTSELVSA